MTERLVPRYDPEPESEPSLPLPLPPRLPDPHPTLNLIGLGEALACVEAVAAANQAKHPGAKWAQQTLQHQDGKCISHLGRAQHGEPVDEDTGLPARAHAALRLLMALGLELRNRSQS